MGQTSISSRHAFGPHVAEQTPEKESCSIRSSVRHGPFYGAAYEGVRKLECDLFSGSNEVNGLAPIKGVVPDSESARFTSPAFRLKNGGDCACLSRGQLSNA